MFSLIWSCIHFVGGILFQEKLSYYVFIVLREKSLAFFVILWKWQKFKHEMFVLWKDTIACMEHGVVNEKVFTHCVFRLRNHKTFLPWNFFIRIYSIIYIYEVEWHHCLKHSHFIIIGYTVWSNNYIILHFKSMKHVIYK